jgi:hypothetical protein
MIAESLLMDSRGARCGGAGWNRDAERHIDGVIAVRDQLSYAGTPR